MTADLSRRRRPGLHQQLAPAFGMNDVRHPGLEEMQNAAMHASDAAVRIELRLTDAGLVWSVADDGPGFTTDTAASAGGLTGMRERVAALDGVLTVNSSPARAVVEWSLPRSVGFPAPPDRVD
jgi:signal transduction histidine kinase